MTLSPDDLRGASPTFRKGLTGLTVGELVTLLRACDHRAPVVVSGPYGGFDEVRQLRTVGLSLHVNGQPEFGPHDLPAPGEEPQVEAVAVLSLVHSDLIAD